MQLTIVCREAVWADNRLLCEMTDGTLAEFVHHGRPTEQSLRFCAWKSAEQLVEVCREANTYHRELTRPMGRYSPQLAGLAYGGQSLARWS